MENTSFTRKYLVLVAGVILFLSLVMIVAPLARAKAAQISARPPDVLQAEAEWFRARGEFYAALPETLLSGGAAALQASYSILLGALGIGIGLLVLSAAITFSMKAFRQELSRLADQGFVTGREFRDGTTSQFFIVNPDTAVERYLLSRGADIAYSARPTLGTTSGAHPISGASEASEGGNTAFVFDADSDPSERSPKWPPRSRSGGKSDPDQGPIRFRRRKV